MPLCLDSRDPDFARAFHAFVTQRREEVAEVRESVARILADVEQRGDAALIAYTRRFDGFDLTPDRLRITPEEIAQARAAVDAATRDALLFAAERIRRFHEHQRPPDLRLEDELGIQAGIMWRPIDAVGLYVPGGTAAYPSSVLMNAIPARVAGCRRIVMTVPTPQGALNPLVLVAAEIAGVDEIYRVGGAQAIAALAFGTETIAAVDKIFGPGNAYVAEAKRQVFGRVGIDMIAGPSELVVIADAAASPAWAAADLLSQAEHDPRAQTVLLSDDDALLAAVAREVEAQLAALPRREIAAASWRDHGALLRTRDLEEAVELANRLAPEHLELMVAEPERLCAQVRHAGAVFLGAHTPEVIGDYVGGPNHVLPTGRTARFSSGLGVHDFMKRTTVLGCGAKGFAALAPHAAVLARAEGLEAHARAVACRSADAG